MFVNILYSSIVLNLIIYHKSILLFYYNVYSLVVLDSCNIVLPSEWKFSTRYEDSKRIKFNDTGQIRLSNFNL